MLERVIEAYLVKRVKALGGEVRKVQWPGRRGAPDRLVMLPGKLAQRSRQTPSGERRTWMSVVRRGRTIWVELKAPGKTPDPLQVAEHKLMRRLGQRVEVIDSLEGVDRLLS